MYSPLPTDNAWQRAGSLIRRARQVMEMRKAGHCVMRISLECSRRFSWVRGSHPEPAASGYGSIDGSQRRQSTDAFETTGLADFKPWREAGWIFRDGVCVVIERQGPLSRARAVVE
jgi:hypothetical protein